MIESWVAVLIVSSISLIGFFTLKVNVKKLKEVTFLLVSLAVGALFGDVFFHLLPELAEDGFTHEMGVGVIAGILIFLLIEKFVHWRHCHEPITKEHTHPLAVMNLIGDGLHNFLDGVLIAASFAVSPTVGVATTVAVILHEIPQEIADFGVLIHAGMSVKKALIWNFMSGLLAVMGVIFFAVFGEMDWLEPYMVPLVVGGFLYIAGSDLVPELHKETKWRRSLLQVAAVVVGLVVMWLLLGLE